MHFHFILFTYFSCPTSLGWSWHPSQSASKSYGQRSCNLQSFTFNAFRSASRFSIQLVRGIPLLLSLQEFAFRMRFGCRFSLTLSTCGLILPWRRYLGSYIAESTRGRMIIFLLRNNYWVVLSPVCLQYFLCIHNFSIECKKNERECEICVEAT